MRIAQVAPLCESVPPRLYGGSERIVSYLTEELVRLGHHVTLFASGDFMTAAELVPCVPIALRLNQSVRDPIPYFMLMMGRVAERAAEFDIIHFHIDQFQMPTFRAVAGRTVTTLHGRQDSHDMRALYAGFPEMPLVRSRMHSERQSPMRTSSPPSTMACRRTSSSRLIIRGAAIWRLSAALLPRRGSRERSRLRAYSACR